MQFVLIIYHGTSPLPGTDAWNDLEAAEQKQIYADYAEINENANITLRLPPIAPGQATTVQVAKGNVQVKEGPHMSEGIAGAFVFEADSLEAAITLAASIPQARMGGAVEVRPVQTYF